MRRSSAISSGAYGTDYLPKNCCCLAIPSMLTAKRKCPHYGECDIDAARAGKTSDTQQLTGWIYDDRAGSDTDGSERTPHQAHASGLQRGWSSESLEHFLSSLPELWRQGEVRPTHAPKKRTRRGQRIRPDPFEGVYCEILDWLQQQPDTKAVELLDRLIARYPNPYSRRQLRTLQRRVRQWRIVVAKQLVYAPAEQNEMNEADRGSIKPVGDN